MTTVLKLGGSVVTDKETPETVDDDALEQVVEAVADADVSRLVLVHGAGSFGHHHADKHGVTPTAGSHDAGGVWAIHDSMRRLNDEIVGRLQDAGVPALPIHPLSAGAREADSTLSLATDSAETMLAEGFVPVLHGDVIAQSGAGATIISGDELITHFAHALDADRVGLCSTVPGVYDESGEIVPRITRFDDVADALGGAESTDVTGGMAAKIRALLDLGAPAFVFGPDDLGEFLAGRSVGTVVDG